MQRRLTLLITLEDIGLPETQIINAKTLPVLRNIMYDSERVIFASLSTTVAMSCNDYTIAKLNTSIIETMLE